MAGRNGKRNTHTWETAKWLEAFAETASVSQACEAVGIARSTAYRRRDSEPEFEAAWDAIDEKVADDLEAEAYRRAVEGVEEPKTVAGQKVMVRRYSDRLLEMLLRARRPEKYRDRISVEDEREAAKRKEFEAMPEEELDRELAGMPDNVTPIRKAS